MDALFFFRLICSTIPKTITHWRDSAPACDLLVARKPKGTRTGHRTGSISWHMNTHRAHDRAESKQAGRGRRRLSILQPTQLKDINVDINPWDTINTPHARGR